MKTALMQATSEFVSGSLSLVQKMAGDLQAFETSVEETRAKAAGLASKMRRLGLINDFEEKQASELLLDPSKSADMMDVFLDAYAKLQTTKSAGADESQLGSGSGGYGGDARELSEADRVCLNYATGRV